MRNLLIVSTLAVGAASLHNSKAARPWFQTPTSVQASRKPVLTIFSAPDVTLT